VRVERIYILGRFSSHIRTDNLPTLHGGLFEVKLVGLLRIGCASDLLVLPAVKVRTIRARPFIDGSSICVDSPFR